MKDVKLNYQTDKVYVGLALDDPKEDIHERYLYVFKSSDFKNINFDKIFEKNTNCFKINQLIEQKNKNSLKIKK